MVALLLEKGASIEATDKDGNTALELALEWGHDSIADLLRSKLASTQNDSQNLRRSEKQAIGLTSEEGNLKASILANNPENEKVKELVELSKLQASVTIQELPISKDSQTKEPYPIIQLIPETNHKTDHANIIDDLISAIKNHLLPKGTAIALERKQNGNNLGMSDVIMLANIIGHNKINMDHKITVPEFIKGLPIYKDAKLYNLARIKGIKVIGIEGKGLEVSKESSLYNQVREEYMAIELVNLAASVRNVIFPVGADHVEKLSGRLEAVGMEVN
ncbi:MAG: hypothetical protein K0R73_1009 [Candidatus Midichloriaceae bacterium]|nr:hypothetical protein [Candidatus Midichloriaceae bacterium]